MKFVRMLEYKPGNKASEDRLQKWENTLFYDIADVPFPSTEPIDDEKPRNIGRPTVTLGDSPWQKK